MSFVLSDLAAAPHNANIVVGYMISSMVMSVSLAGKKTTVCQLVILCEVISLIQVHTVI